MSHKSTLYNSPDCPNQKWCTKKWCTQQWCTQQQWCIQQWCTQQWCTQQWCTQQQWCIQQWCTQQWCTQQWCTQQWCSSTIHYFCRHTKALVGFIQQAPPDDVEEPASTSRLETVWESHSARGISTQASALIMSRWSKGKNATYQSG